MDDVGFGRLLRAVRIRRGWRQADVAERSGVSRAQVWRAESARLGELRLSQIRGIAGSLEIRLHLDATWRGGDADRLVNDAHVGLVGRVLPILNAAGWTCAVEATFSVWGERGSIDVLAWHPATCSLLVVEVKTELADPAGLVAQVDRYRRLGPTVARERGWEAEVGRTSVWVVVAESSMNRNRLGRAEDLLRTALPVRGHAVRGWLKRPSDAVAALSFLLDAPPGSANQKARAVRRVRTRSEASGGEEPSRDARSGGVAGEAGRRMGRRPG